MAGRQLGDDERRRLLEAVAQMSPDADLTTREGIHRIFLPLPEYRRVLDDRVVLVLGDRGVGKSALFHFLQSEGRSRLAQAVGTPHEWLVGFSETDREHPAPLVLEELVREPGLAEGQARSFWLGHLAGRVAAKVGEDVTPPEALSAWRAAPTNPGAWVDAFRDPTTVLLWFDRVERHLGNEGRTLVVTYDHLDRIGVRNRKARRSILPPLLALWLSFSNRYRSLCAKIFLRHDLFRESVPHTSDVSKLQARAETIRWTTSALYRLLLRHMAGGDDELRSWLDSGRNQIPLTDDPILGWLPPENLPETGSVSQQALMEHLVGKAMGDTTDARAGYPHRWVPAKLADANGIVSPRSMITLFSSAARHALNFGPGAGFTRLLTPDEMKAGLREASNRRVEELLEEHPVVKRLGNLADEVLPLSTVRAGNLFARSAGDSPDGFGEAGGRVLEELVHLGVVSTVGRDRIDIPDICRLHFGIKRKGQKVATDRGHRGR